jgi:hypothetical protein
MPDTVERIDAVIVVAARTMRDSFRVYWPTHGDTGAHERNLSLHVASAFLNAGFAVFGEGHRDGEADVRYDVLAYSPEQSLFVAAEFKHLWSPGSARSMRDDIERLRDFTPVGRVGSAGTAERFGLVAAFTERDARFAQLLGHDVSRECGATRELVDALPGTQWRAQPICDHGRHPDRGGPLELVYAAFPLGR